MNKKLLLVMLAIILLLYGCGNKNVEESTEATLMETTKTESPTETTPYVVPGVEVYVAEDGGDGVTLDEENQEPVENVDNNNKSETEITEPSNEDDKSAQNPEQETEAENNKEITEYERYLSMSGAEQEAFIEGFGSVDSFFKWLNQAKADYEAKIPVTEINGDTIDFSQIAGK